MYDYKSFDSRNGIRRHFLAVTRHEKHIRRYVNLTNIELTRCKFVQWPTFWLQITFRNHCIGSTKCCARIYHGNLLQNSRLRTYEQHVRSSRQQLQIKSSAWRPRHVPDMRDQQLNRFQLCSYSQQRCAKLACSRSIISLHVQRP